MSFVPRHQIFAALLGLCLPFSLASAQTPAPALGSLNELAFSQLSDRSLNPLGQSALAIRPTDWKHAESKNFVYHYFHSFVATPVSVEAEFYYGVVAKELEKDTSQWERKCHIFIFEQKEDWADFQKRGALDPWTGGIHSRGELFITRQPENKFKDDTLGHEITHLVVDRFFGNGIPLWLNEGYAQYAAARGYAAFHRARGYNSRPTTDAVNPAHYIALSELTSASTYPADVLKVHAFYDESQRLVRFLSAANKPGFIRFLDSMAHGNLFENALSKGFAGRFNLESLEREFKPYAIKDYGGTP